METGYLIKMVGLCICLGTIGYGIPASKTVYADQYPPGQWETIIDNQDFTQPLNLDTGDDHTLIINATFHDIDSSAIMIRNVSNVYIKDCLIHDINGDGIVLRSTGGSQNVTIDGCTIYNTARSGIIAKQRSKQGVNHTNLIIKNNIVYNSGKTKYDHNIYVQTTDSLIENNVIHGSSGHGISIRSSGVIRGNKIWDTRKSCIRYYSDNVAEVSSALTIENNICYQTEPGAGSPAISLLWANSMPEARLVHDYYIRFNTVVLFTGERYNFAVESDAFAPGHIELYGNLFINTGDISKTLNLQYLDYISSNYTSASLEGFANAARPPYDFQLTGDSPARFFASTEPRFPATDINGTVRVAGYLDAGAHQFSVKPGVENSAKPADVGQVELSLEKSAVQSQNSPLVEAPNQPSALSANPVSQSQDKPSSPQNEVLNDTLVCFAFLIGLLVVAGVIAAAGKSIR
jgi:hypothetical protein